MASARLLTALRFVSGLVAAIPAVGLGVFVLVEGLTEPGGMPLDRVFHLLLGLGLLALFSEFAISILRCRTPRGILAWGTGGFMAGLLAAVMSELLGPPILLVLLGATGVWAVILLRLVRGLGAFSSGQGL